MTADAQSIHRGATSERGRRILAHLKHLESVTIDELTLDIATMQEMESFHKNGFLVSPRRIAQELAVGPVAPRYRCRVCTAFGEVWYRDDSNWDLASPLYRVFAYHEVPRIHCRFKDQEYFGRHANEIYERCIHTYRAAGWTGAAKEPNA